MGGRPKEAANGRRIGLDFGFGEEEEVGGVVARWGEEDGIRAALKSILPARVFDRPRARIIPVEFSFALSAMAAAAAAR